MSRLTTPKHTTLTPLLHVQKCACARIYAHTCARTCVCLRARTHLGHCLLLPSLPVSLSGRVCMFWSLYACANVVCVRACEFVSVRVCEFDLGCSCIFFCSELLHVHHPTGLFAVPHLESWGARGWGFWETGNPGDCVTQNANKFAGIPITFQPGLNSHSVCRVHLLGPRRHPHHHHH